MKIKLARLVVVFLLWGVGSVWGARHVYAAPRLTLDPTSATVVNGASIQLGVTIDVENNQAFGADAILSYDSSDFDVTAVGNGGFFSDFSWGNDTGGGKLEIHGYFSALFASKSGLGTLATVTLKAKKDTGSSLVSFSCGGSGSTTKILNTNNANILSCGDLNQSTITFGSQTQPTSTPIPTATPNPTATSAPSGNDINPICESLSANRTSGSVPLTVSFTCTGSDQDSDINYAEFTFGDGQQLSIEKNVGSKGTIAASHTYTIAGSFAASCRMRDTNGSFSSRPATCLKIITVSAAGSGTTGIRPTATPRPTPKPTVGMQIVPLSTVTPTPIPSFALPSEAPSEEQKAEWVFPWTSISVGAVILGGLFLVWWYMRRKPPMPPPPAGGSPFIPV